MIKLGRIKAAFQHIKKYSDKFKPDADFYLKLLQKCPELEFANAVAKVCLSLNNGIRLSNQSFLFKESVSVEQIVSVLLDSEQPHNGLKFIKTQIDNMSKGMRTSVFSKVLSFSHIHII